MGRRRDRIKINKGLEKDLTRYAYEMMKSMGNKVKKELDEAALIAIGEPKVGSGSRIPGSGFYGDYDPMRYVRHVWNFRKNSHHPFYENDRKMKKLRAGVILSSKSMMDVYNEDTEKVFNLVYSGVHGHRGIKVMATSPYHMIVKRRDEIANNVGYLENIGIAAAKKKKYEKIIIK